MMESSDQTQYETLDLEPFTFSSPNATDWNEIEYQNILEATKHEVVNEKIAKDSSSYHDEMFIELCVNETDVLTQISTGETKSTPSTHNSESTLLLPNWKQPLALPKPKVEQKSFPNISSNMDHHYLNELKKMHAVRYQRPKTIENHSHPNNLVKQSSITTNDPSSNPTEESLSQKSKKSPTNIENLLSSMLSKEGPKSTFHTNLQPNEQLIQLIHQLNKQTMEKLQKRLRNKNG